MADIAPRAREQNTQQRLDIRNTVQRAAALVIVLLFACPLWAWGAQDPEGTISAQSHETKHVSAEDTGGRSTDDTAMDKEQLGPTSFLVSSANAVDQPPLYRETRQQTIDIRWRETSDPMMTLADDGGLSVGIDGVRDAWNPLVVGAVVEWTSSGSENHEPGEVEIRIPDHLFLSRNGSPYEPILLNGSPYLQTGLEVSVGVPEAPAASPDGWQYRHDAEAHEIIITNASNVGAGTKLVCEVDYAYATDSSYYYGAEYDGVLHPTLTELSNVPVRLYASEKGAGVAQTGFATLSTENVLKDASVEVSGVYDSWQDCWGEAPTDGEESLYAVWKATATIDHFYQPYDLRFDIPDPPHGSIVGISDAWVGGSPENATGEFSPESATFMNPEDTAVGLGDADAYRAYTDSSGIIAFSDEALNVAMLVRYDKTWLDEQSPIELFLSAKAILNSVDGDAQERVGEGSFEYKSIGFEAPPGNRFALQRAEGASGIAELNALYYYQDGQIDRLASGQESAPGVSTSAAYASCYASTLEKDGDALDPASYGKRPYSFDLIDDFAFAGSARLDESEYEIQAVLDINSAAVTLYEGVADYAQGSYAVQPVEGAIDPLDVTLSVRFGDSSEWIPAARWTQNESGRMDCSAVETLLEEAELRAFDPSSVLGYWHKGDELSEYDGAQRYDLILPSGVTGVKLGFETTAWAASVGDYGSDNPEWGLITASSVKSSERLRSLAESSQSLVVDKASTLVARNAEGALLGFEGEPDDASKDSALAQELVDSGMGEYGASMYRALSDAVLKRAKKDGGLVGAAGNARNNTAEKTVEVGSVYAASAISTRTQESQASGSCIQPPEHGGTFYVLLPRGFSADVSTVKASERLSGGHPFIDTKNLPIDGGAVKDERYSTDENGNIGREHSADAEVSAVELSPNWKDSGQDLLIVTVRTSDRNSGISEPYDNREYVSGFILSFGGRYSWDAMADYGTNLDFRFIYESANPDLSTWNARGNAASDASWAPGWSDDARTLLSDLDGENSRQSRWYYGSAATTVNFPTAAEYGLKLSAKALDDSVWKHAGDDDGCVEVYAGEQYQYRIRTALEPGGSASDSVLYCPLERFSDDAHSSAWHGTLEDIDTSAITVAGANPCIYYTTREGLDFADKAVLDLSNTDLWSTDPPNSREEITAVAIDCTKTASGDAFRLEGGESLSAVLTMRAPIEHAADLESSMATAYCQAWLASTVTSATGAESNRVIHHEATAVRLKTMSFEFVKIAENEAVVDNAAASSLDQQSPIEGARFVLYRFVGTGEPAYGDHEGWAIVGEASSNPWVRFEGLAPGLYRLVETQAPFGFIKPSGQWAIRLDPLLPQETTIDAEQAGGGEAPPAAVWLDEGLAIPNTALPSLPLTGGQGMALIAAVGGMAVCVGIIARSKGLIGRKANR